MPFPNLSLTSFRSHGKPLKAVERVLVHVDTVLVDLRTRLQPVTRAPCFRHSQLDPTRRIETLLAITGTGPRQQRWEPR